MDQVRDLTPVGAWWGIIGFFLVVQLVFFLFYTAGLFVLLLVSGSRKDVSVKELLKGGGIVTLIYFLVEQIFGSPTLVQLIPVKLIPQGVSKDYNIIDMPPFMRSFNLIMQVNIDFKIYRYFYALGFTILGVFLVFVISKFVWKLPKEKVRLIVLIDALLTVTGWISSNWAYTKDLFF